MWEYANGAILSRPTFLKAAYTNVGKTPPNGALKITQISELPALIKKTTPSSILRRGYPVWLPESHVLITHLSLEDCLGQKFLQEKRGSFQDKPCSLYPELQSFLDTTYLPWFGQILSHRFFRRVH